jgi:hypothetical protein
MNELSPVHSDAGRAERRALVVLGMHRSGTSAMTKTLALLGASLPAGLMAPKESDNEAGFWEPWRVAELNNEILNAVDSEWDDVFAYRPKEYLSNVDRFYLGRAVDLLSQEFGGSQLIALKDPRISVLTTFWHRVLREAGYAPHYVIMVRNPLEVAESLRARDLFPREKSLLLWSSYMIAADRDTRDCDRIFVSYDQLLTDWRSVRDRIEKSAGIPFPRNTAAAANDIDRQLDRRLRQHQIGADHLFSRSDVTDDVKVLYRIFSAACDGAEVERAAVDAIEAELAKMDSVIGPLLADQRSRALGLSNELVELNNLHEEVCNRATSLSEQLMSERAERQVEADAAVQAAAHRDCEIADLSARAIAAEAQRDQIAGEWEVDKQRKAELKRHILSLEAERDRLVAAERGRADQFKQNFDALTLEIERTRTELTAERLRRVEEVARLERLANESEDKLRRANLQLAAAEAAARSSETKLSERFSELAKLSGMLLERDRKLAKEAEKAQRRQELYRALSWRPRWWSILSVSQQTKLQQKRLRRLGIFDGQSYLKVNPDVAANGMDPLDHYMNHGIDEDRSLHLEKRH